MLSLNEWYLTPHHECGTRSAERRVTETSASLYVYEKHLNVEKSAGQSRADVLLMTASFIDLVSETAKRSRNSISLYRAPVRAAPVHVLCEHGGGRSKVAAMFGRPTALTLSLRRHAIPIFIAHPRCNGLRAGHLPCSMAVMKE